MPKAAVLEFFVEGFVLGSVRERSGVLSTADFIGPKRLALAIGSPAI